MARGRAAWSRPAMLACPAAARPGRDAGSGRGQPHRGRPDRHHETSGRPRAAGGRPQQTAAATPARRDGRRPGHPSRGPSRDHRNARLGDGLADDLPGLEIQEPGQRRFDHAELARPLRDHRGR